SHYGPWSAELALPTLENQSPPRIADIQFPGIFNAGFSGNVLLTYRAIDDDRDSVDVRVSYRTQESDPWAPANEFSDIFHSGLRDLPTSTSAEGGALHSFRWDTRGVARSGFAEQAQLRLEVTDGNGPVQETITLTPQPVGTDGEVLFEQTVSLVAGGAIDRVIGGDFDDDGDTDLVVAIAPSGGTSLRLSRYYSNTDEFAALEPFGPNASIAEGLAADHTDDETPELVVFTNPTPSSTVMRVYSWTGASFAELTTATGGAAIRFIDVGDYNGDGVKDVIAFGDNGNCLLFAGITPGVPGDALTGICRSTDTRVTGVTTIHINGDAAADIVVAEPVSNQVTVLHGSTTGLPTEVATFTDQSFIQELATADLDGDGSCGSPAHSLT
ncbi:MAG: VCBS repeat-containing protein, partial [Myxococcota bacterium]